MSRRFFIYCRASTPRAQRGSWDIETQKKALLDYAARAGITIRRIFTEHASAGRPDARPIFTDLLRRIERGEANAILTWDLSRLSRNLHDDLRLGDMLYRGTVKQIRTPAHAVMHGFLLHLHAVFHEHQRQTLSQAMKRGLRARASRNKSF